MMIAPDATIADIVTKLREPEEYVRRALGNFHAVVKVAPTAQITLGVTGNGAYPNYKIDPPLVAELFDNEPIHGMTLGSDSRVFSGRTHNVLLDPEKVRAEHWSSRSMTIKELQTLLGQIRKAKR